MTITLPDEMRAELERQAKAAGFATAEEYAVQILRAVALADAEDTDDMPVPDELQIKSRADLEAKLLAGLNSGQPIRVTPEFWANLRRRAQKPQS